MRASTPNGRAEGGYTACPWPRRGTAEDRLQALEAQRGRDNEALVKAHERFAALQQICDENTKIMLEMRRELYGTKNTVEEHRILVANRFDTTEKTVEQYLALLTAHQAETAQKIEQLPQAGQIVMANFQSITAEIEGIKQTKGETFTRQMCDELELMRQHVLAHERQITEIAGAGTHYQLLIDNLGFAYAQLVDTVEKYAAPPDGESIPETRSDWQRPPRRATGLPNEQSYGGCGGYPGNS